MISMVHLKSYSSDSSVTDQRSGSSGEGVPGPFVFIGDRKSLTKPMTCTICPAWTRLLGKFLICSIDEKPAGSGSSSSAESIMLPMAGKGGSATVQKVEAASWLLRAERELVVIPHRNKQKAQPKVFTPDKLHSSVRKE